jgi:hypothetical protein
MAAGNEPRRAVGEFGQVAVEFVQQRVISESELDDGGSDGESGLGPGFEDASGVRERLSHGARTVVVAGEQTVLAATKAIGTEIARTADVIADQITNALDARVTQPVPGALGLDSVEVTFGITLSAGVQTVFSTKGESSTVVKIVLKRSP